MHFPPASLHNHEHFFMHACVICLPLPGLYQQRHRCVFMGRFKGRHLEVMGKGYERGPPASWAERVSL